MKTALLISTYNWPEALTLILKSVSLQSRMPDEILIADDGSTKETSDLIEKLKDKYSLPVKHFWHEDRGFRKTAILNKAIAATDCDYIVQVDGDCILHPDFVKDHIALSEKNTYLFGSRVNITKPYLEKLFKKEKIYFSFFSEGIKKRSRTLRIPLFSRFFKKSNRFSKKFRGCNFSFFRNDFIAVNGYDENFTGWGREDSELAIRLLNNGTSGKRIRYRGIVYHIYHKQLSKNNLSQNHDIQRETISQKKTWCVNGINKY